MIKPLFTMLAVLALAAISPITERGAEAAPPVTLGITLSSTSITFPDQDPDFFPVSQQSQAPIRVIATSKNLGAAVPYSCSILARGDLTSGPATISVSNISWTAVTINGDAGETFYNGTLSRTTAVRVAQGYDNDSRRSPLTGDLTFSIQNLWTYATGNYSQVVDFTITAP
jgi:hypothetical protein